MLVKMIPQFEDGLILKRHMLKAVADAAFLTGDYLHAGYADGILAGCRVEAAADRLFVKEGVVLSDGQIYLIREPLAVSYAPANRTMVLKLCFSDEIRDADCIYRELDLVLTEQTKVQRGQLELCRFKLQEGAVLRSRYQDFEDRNTEFDTLNTIYAPYSAVGEATLAPEITKGFAREMLAKDGITDFDALFCLQILGGAGPVGKEALRGYLERRNREKVADDSNMGIYRELVRILRQENGAGKTEAAPKKKKWKVMMD